MMTLEIKSFFHADTLVIQMIDYPILDCSLCRTLKVSETGFYKWKRNRTKMKRRQLLLVEIHKILS